MSFEAKSEVPGEHVIKLNEPVSAFIFPLKRWHGQSGHLSSSPGLYSSIVLQSDHTPDLRLHTIVQNKFPLIRNAAAWQFRIEADKRYLQQHDLLEENPNDLSAGAFVSGRSPLESFLLTPNVWLQVAHLRAMVTTPDGIYEAQPFLAALDEGEILFDYFRDRQKPEEKLHIITVNPNDEDYLKTIQVEFSYDITNKGKLPKNLQYPGMDPNANLESWVALEAKDNVAKAEQLRQRAFRDPVFRRNFLYPPASLTY